MRKKDPIVYISDMLKYCESVQIFTKGINFSTFSRDDKTIFAVIRSIEVIGEASKKVPKGIKEKHNQIPWREIAGMRDKLVHEYFGIDNKVVWKTAKNDIPKLNKRLQAIILQLETDPKLKF